MSLPEYERKIYEKNCLTQVVCQLRFPSILRITGEEPVQVQESLRLSESGQCYLNYATKMGISSQFPPELAAALPPELGGMASPFHEFSTEDGKWTISLGRDFLSFSSRDFNNWEDFEIETDKGIGALMTAYKPKDFRRIGLRFQNAIVPSEVGFEGRPWSEMINPLVLGELAGQLEDAEFEMSMTRVLVNLKDNTRIMVNHGLANTQGLPLAKPNCYAIDIDCFTDKQTEIQNAREVLRKLNQNAFRYFRWCISDGLHEKLGKLNAGSDKQPRENCA